MKKNPNFFPNKFPLSFFGLFFVCFLYYTFSVGYI